MHVINLKNHNISPDKNPQTKYTTIKFCYDNIHTFLLGCFAAAAAAVIVWRCLREGVIYMLVDSGELLYPEYYQILRFQDSYNLEHIKE